MDLFQVVILSVVEGITEFLPISSTGHLILTSRLLNIPQTEFVKSFEIIIQLGAILAVVIIYWKRLLLQKQLWKKDANREIELAEEQGAGSSENRSKISQNPVRDS